MDVRSCRGADADSDHYLVRIRYRQKIDLAKTEKAKRTARHNIEGFKNGELKEEYKKKIADTLEIKKELWEKGEVESIWNILKTIVSEAADDTLGKKEQGKRVEWFDEECLTAIRERNEARKKMLQRRTRLTTEEYREKRKSADIRKELMRERE